MKIGILQAGLAPEVLKKTYEDYNLMFEKLLQGHNFSFQTFKVILNQFPISSTQQDAWIITGSKHGAYEELDWIKKLKIFLKTTYQQKIPIIGICFGHQILAEALGGKVEKFSGGWKIGFEKLRMQGISNGDDILSFYQDQVVKNPEESKVVGSTDFCKNAMLVYKNHAMSVQQHPEFTPEYVGKLLAERAYGIPQEVVTNAKENLHKKVSGGVLKKMVAFLKLHQH